MPKRYFLAAARRGLLFAFIWWVLAEGSPYGWAFGLSVVVGVTYFSLRLLPPPEWRLNWLALPALLIYFLAQSILAGIDVAWRAFHPKLPIRPALIVRKLSLKPSAAQLLMTWTLSLLPGTVSVRLHEGDLEIHIIDENAAVNTVLDKLEQHIGRLFQGVGD